MFRAIRWSTVVLACCVLVSLSGCSRPTMSIETIQVSVAPKERAEAKTEVFQVEQYHSHIALLAHDELKGRGTGHYGIDLAAGYIAGQLASFGLQPGGPDGTYFQEYTITVRPQLQDDTSLSFDGVQIALTLRDDFLPFGFSSTGSFKGDVVFVGYGTTNEEKSHDDYAGIDVQDKVVLMLRREPPAWQADGWTSNAQFTTKVALAIEHGAAAVIIVNQDPGEDGRDVLMPFRMRAASTQSIPVIHLKRSSADAILTAAGLASLSALQQKLDGGTTVSAELAGVTAQGNVSIKSNDMLARNVIGVLPGMGPNADEYIVFGAHYDHLGQRRGQIHNGADDNASGTAGVIEVARALSQTPYRNRSVICMTFSGEEIGLKGSKYFASTPTVAIEQIKAMLNMDMIGRLSDEHANMLAIQGLGTGDSFHELVDRHTSAMDIAFLPDESAKGPSDHDSFYRAGVPSLFFFTGVHSDYPRPGADTEKINFQGGTDIARLVYNIGLDLINVRQGPVYAKVDARANIFRSSPGAAGNSRNEVVMGIMPDFEDASDKKGWRIATVMPNGPAAVAGMKSGDRILKIGETAIAAFEDYLNATRGKKPGDVVNVTLLRGEAELSVDVKLGARG